MLKPYRVVIFPLGGLAIASSLLLLTTQYAHAITIGPGDNYTSGIIASGTTHVEMTGGSIISSGSSGYALRLLDNSTAHISGGLLRSTNAFGWSTINAEDHSV